MPTNRFQHVDIRVHDLDAALAFYSKFLPALGREAGGRNISGPRDCPEYNPTYYAVFFEDPSGNCLEVCYLEER